jgi:pyruvate/2-oxoglutarate/acetoin dehydrogenase E1 component/TPP-dependent pyruvate/acetoin dehydrogenase alpha subunit
MSEQLSAAEQALSFEHFRSAVLADYRHARISRETSLLGRREVLGGKAKFGIFGDGKEVAQVAMAKFFQPGDFRSGYYRDQTFMLAAGLTTVRELFAQLYADPDPANEPASSGRQMNAHFSTPFLKENGDWLPLAKIKNVSADSSPTSGQMTRALGLAFASKSFREIPALHSMEDLSNKGNEVCFATIGDASTSEGHFWESINAAGVLQVPLAVFVWDDGYGISVPKKYQTTKGSISEALSGMQADADKTGLRIYTVKGWDYAACCEVFEEGIRMARQYHTPVLFHVEELTQPQGHSTSGSHERYKSAERLQWEEQWDGLRKMREWILSNGLATESELNTIDQDAVEQVKQERTQAWEQFNTPIREQLAKAADLLDSLSNACPEQAKDLKSIVAELRANRTPLRRDIMKALHRSLDLVGTTDASYWTRQYFQELQTENTNLYNTHLYNEKGKSALQVPEVKADIPADAPVLNGFEILNKYFDQLFARDPRVIAFGEDLGHIGDVNQGFMGLQEKYGVQRIFDTGIRELTIIGQGVGLAMRGLRPIAEMQYLDYLLFGLQPLSDDVSTLHYRTGGKQSCPLIVRTRGHRLEGIWHSGSPMGMIIHALRGMHVCVPRNMTQAAGMYNTLLQANDPGLVIECLNGYRLKESLPNNLDTFTVALGVPEVIEEGEDVTIVSYGSTLRIIQEATQYLRAKGISCEIIDVQTLLPFDLHHRILESLKKTNRILFVDEDVPGGASAYMFTEVMEKQGGYRYLDVAPRTLTAQAHRPGYGSDGDYFSKPNAEQVIEVVKAMMAE